MYVACSRMIAVIMAVTWLTLWADAQHRSSSQETATFAAPDGAFRFEYPSNFQVCTNVNLEPCHYAAFMPVCSEDALVCILYPRQEFKDTNFGAAGFEVVEVLQHGTTPDECVTPHTGHQFLLSAEHPTELIGGVSFVHGTRDGAAMGHTNDTEVYRAFHKGRCFQLSVSETETTPDTSSGPPMKTLTPAQERKIEQVMSHILHSFRFAN